MRCKEKQVDYLRGIIRNNKLILQVNSKTISIELPSNENENSNLVYLNIVVTSDGQILFPNVIPSGKTVNILEINGLLYHKDEDFSISNTTISWIGDFSLITSDEIIMWVS